MLGYDYSTLHSGLMQGNRVCMLEEACRFTHHLRTRILHDGRIEGIGMSQGLRFLKECLGHMVVTL